MSLGYDIFEILVTYVPSAVKLHADP